MATMRTARLWGFLLLSALGTGNLPAQVSPETVLAEAGGGTVTVGELIAAGTRDRLGADSGPGTESFTDAVRRRVRDLATARIVSAEGRRLGLFEDPEIEGRLLWTNWLAPLALASNHFVTAELSITGEDVSAEFERRIQDYRLEPRAAWRHIYLRARTPAEMAEARRRAEELMAQLRAGADFNTLAAQHSQAQALSQPLVDYRGRFFPALVQALDTAPQGEPTGPIETPVGIFIIVVDQRETERFVPRESARVGLTMEMINRTQAETRQRVLSRLREQWDSRIEWHPEATTGSDASAPVLVLGPWALSAHDYRLLGPQAMSLNPDESPWAPDSRVCLREMADQMILVQAYRESGSYNPVAVEKQRQFLLLEAYEEVVEPAVLEALRPQVTEEALRRLYEARRSDLPPVDLFTVEEMALSPRELVTLAGSNSNLDVQNVRGDLLRRAQRAASLRDLVRELDLDPRPPVRVTLTTLERPDASLAARVQNLSPGEIAPLESDYGDLRLIKLVSVERGVPPPLEIVRREMRDLHCRSLGVRLLSREEILASLRDQWGIEFTPALEEFISSITPEQVREWDWNL